MNEPLTALGPEQVAPDRLLRRLDWHVIRRLDGVLQGDYRTLFYGIGVDFADLREYQLQDDIRHIDWNVTARMDAPYVRQYREDRDVTAWFLLDISPSMGFGPLARPKEQVLIELVATLGRLLTRNGNRIGAILYKQKIEKIIPPRGGRSQVLRFIHEIQRAGKASNGAPTQLDLLLRAGLNGFRRRSLVFVVSDFISEPGWERSLSLLNQRHDLIGLRLWDPRESELPNAGVIVVEDAETGEQLFVDTSDVAFRRRFARAAARREEALEATLKRAGVDLFAVSTEENLVGAFVRIARLRKRRRR